eukprot:gb/GFBE01047324.1/.p1 GENE.gb/GFBE01047324.1/~~gb/GFBE01047324.1/.p1  ORF type:complete len:213 (+),score=12.94 gb/GFBE01047324.1/:1-639(+)
MGKRAFGAQHGNEKKPRLADAEDWDCPICSISLTGRIFQCARGHFMCQECLETLTSIGSQKCPSCNQDMPTPAIRNLGMENLASKLTFACPWDCGFQGLPERVENHKGTCKLRPIRCPVRACTHKCKPSELLQHLSSQQHADDCRVFLGCSTIQPWKKQAYHPGSGSCNARFGTTARIIDGHEVRRRYFPVPRVSRNIASLPVHCHHQAQRG